MFVINKSNPKAVIFLPVSRENYESKILSAPGKVVGFKIAILITDVYWRVNAKPM